MRALRVLWEGRPHARVVRVGLQPLGGIPPTVRLQKAEKALKVAVSERNVQKGDLTVRSACEARSALHTRGREQLRRSLLRGTGSCRRVGARCARDTR